MFCPKKAFLKGLESVFDEDDILLIFDEVMTGFRLAKGGAQEVFNVRPDLTTLGKIIGAGMPVGAYGGRQDVMDFVSPQGPVYQAGTLSGNPVAMAAGYAQLSYLNEHPEVYENIEKTTKKIMSGFESALKKHKLKYTMNQIGSMISLFFTDQKVKDFETAKSCDTELFGKYFRHMLNSGIYLAPSQFESLFISNSIGDEEVKKIVSSFEDFLKA